MRGRAGYRHRPAADFCDRRRDRGPRQFQRRPAPGGTTGSYSDTYIGWTVGGGVEAALTDQVSAKLEYAYSDFGSRTAPAGTLADGNANVADQPCRQVRSQLPLLECFQQKWIPVLRLKARQNNRLDHFTVSVKQ